MGNLNYKIINDVNKIGEEVAKIFVEVINAKPDAVIGLATGSTPIPTYRKLAKKNAKGEVSFNNVKTFNLDEYCCMKKTHKNSFYYFMNKQFFSKIDLKEENINFLNGCAWNFNDECERYEQAILDAGGIDIQLLGIGENGHIGFNEPAKAFSKNTFKIELTDSTRKANSRDFKCKEDVPHCALTMGVDSIFKAKKIVLIATGEKKADAVYAMIKGGVNPDCPASILSKHKDVTIFLDEASASKLLLH